MTKSPRDRDIGHLAIRQARYGVERCHGAVNREDSWQLLSAIYLLVSLSSLTIIDRAVLGLRGCKRSLLRRGQVPRLADGDRPSSEILRWWHNGMAYRLCGRAFVCTSLRLCERR